MLEDLVAAVCVFTDQLLCLNLLSLSQMHPPPPPSTHTLMRTLTVKV